MNTKLTIADVKYLQDKQRLLDSEIMKAKNINLQEWINQLEEELVDAWVYLQEIKRQTRQ